MKLFMVVYMLSSLLDLTFESRDLSEGGNKIKKWQLCNKNDNFFTQNHFESKQLSFCVTIIHIIGGSPRLVSSHFWWQQQQHFCFQLECY